jgi:hypothetical protein
MASDSSLPGPGPGPTGKPRPTFQARPAETPTGLSSSLNSSLAASSGSLAPEIQLELERLRAERDALAAELQIERAERLRAEERLRLFEREKLELMREGAASREKLASELEEARLRAMRAEARQAALDADLRLSEIAERRRGWSPADAERNTTDEIAEPGPDDNEAAEEAEAARLREEARPRTMAGSPPGGTVSKYSRMARGSSATPRESVRPSPPRRESTGEMFGREAPGRESAGRDGALRDASTAERAAPERSATAPSSSGGEGGRLRMSDAPEPRWPSQGAPGAGGREDRDDGARTTDAGTRSTPPRPAPSWNAKAASGAKGGAAAGRPSIDRAQLEMRLAAGHMIEVTDRFRQFQPVAQAHIKICDWLARARTLDDIDALAAGEIARSEIISVLTLFFERSFLVFKQD